MKSYVQTSKLNYWMHMQFKSRKFHINHISIWPLNFTLFTINNFTARNWICHIYRTAQSSRVIIFTSHHNPWRMTDHKRVVAKFIALFGTSGPAVSHPIFWFWLVESSRQDHFYVALLLYVTVFIDQLRHIWLRLRNVKTKRKHQAQIRCTVLSLTKL